MAYLKGGCTLLEDVSYRMIVSLVGMPRRRACITGGLVLLEGVLHSSMCRIEKHNLWEDTFLLESLSYRTTCLT